MNPFIEGLKRYFTEAQLQAIGKEVVAVAGAGGLGSNCAMLLARSGFTNFIIVDMDRLEASNLNRQNYTLSQVGEYKVDALAMNLRSINPDVNVEVHAERLTKNSMKELFAKADILVEAFDNPEMKVAFAECFASGSRLAVSASGIAGYGNCDAIETKKMGESFYIVGDGATGINQAPPLAPRVATAAAKQADIVLAHVLRKCAEA